MVVTDLQREILSIVNSLQFGHRRRRLADGSPIVLDKGVPAAIVQAELSARDGLCVSDVELGAILDELTTRTLLGHELLEHDEWPRVEYRRPDRRVVRTGVDLGKGDGPGSGVREVLLDNDCVAIEFDDRSQPRDSFACYWITSEGLAVLERDDANTPVTDVRRPKRWEPQPGYVGTKTITTDERFRKDGKNPPQSTMQRWVKRSEKEGEPVHTDKAPDSGEKFYPEQWVLEQIERWHPQ